MGCLRPHAIIVALLLSAVPARPSSAALGLGGGADFYAGPESQTSKSVLGFVSAGGAGGAVTGILGRYDSSNLGPGVTGSVVLGLPVKGGSFVQFSGTRSVGDEIYRAWRLAFGTVLAMGNGRSLGIILSRTEENVGAKLNTITSEYSVPLSRSVGSVVRGSVSSVQGGGSAYQGVFGLTWGATKRLQIYGELGLGRDVVTSIQEGGTLEPSAGTAGVEGVTTYQSGASVSTGLRYTLR